MVKKLISSILTIAIVVSTSGPVAFASESVPETMVVATATKEEGTENVPLLSDAPDIIEDREVEENKYVARNKEVEKNEYTLAFKNADGSNTMRVFAFPVKYTDAEGKTKDITLDIKENVDGGFITEDNSIITIFPENEEDGIGLEYEDVNISLVPVESYYVSPVLEETVNLEREIVGQSDNTLFADDFWAKTTVMAQLEDQFIAEEEVALVPEEAVLSEDGKTVSYAWQDKTSLEYSLTYTGFKEDIVVEEYTGQTEYNFILNTNGLKLEKIENSYFLTDEEGIIKANIGDIIIFTADERNNTFGEMEVEAIEENQSYKMIIKVDADYLKDEKTVYPIRIDPSIEVNYSNNGSGAIQDVTINSTGSSDGSSGSLMIGKRDTYGKSRVLMRFPGLDLSGIRSYHLISYAAVEMRDLMCEQEQMAVLCYVFNGSGWNEGSASWGSVSASSYTAGQTTKQVSYAIGSELNPAHRYTFPITGAVQGWKKGTYTQDKGLLFKATDSVENGSTELYKTFASYNRSTYQPSITVQYATTPALSTISSAPYSANKTMTANYAYSYKFTPTVTDQYSLWTTGNLSTKVYVFNSAAMATPISSNQGSGHGNNCCITVKLTGGVSYYFVVQGTSRTTAGTYGLKLYRGLPMSGSEKPSYESYFTGDYPDSLFRLYNCYTYAMGMLTRPDTGGRFEKESIPGQYGNVSIDTINTNNAYNLILQAISADFVDWGCYANDIQSSTQTAMPPEGYFKIALFINDSKGFHFLRQVSDKNGAWAHKPRMEEVLFDDDNDNAIYVPANAEFDSFPNFVGYYVVRAY